MNANTCPSCKSTIPENAPGGLCPACVLRAADETAADSSDAPSLDEVAGAFPKLEIIRLIGHGGMGFVYQARQPELDRTVALKILSPALRRDPAFEERFAREARVLGKLQHPNIVTLFEHGESGGFFYLLMEYIDGVNLRQAMSAGRFTPEQALAIVPAICDALQSAHAEGVWHRDIKPENILLDRDGRVKIADFGIARIVGDPQRNFTLTRTGGMLGSAAYMAPEQHEKPHDVDHRADIYSLGVVIYEMLTGELPLGRFPAPSQRAAVNSRIDEIVLRTLEKERELRQQSAGEVKTEMEGAGTNTEPAKQTVAATSASPLARLPRLVLLPLGLLLVGGVLLWLAYIVGESISTKMDARSSIILWPGPFVPETLRGEAIAIKVLTSLGGASSAFGFLSAFWILFEMKLGWRPTTGRCLIISLSVLPVTLLASIGGFVFLRDAGLYFLMKYETGLIGFAGAFFLASAILFSLIFALARPLKPTSPLRRRLSHAAFGIAICALLVGAVQAKRSNGYWPYSHVMEDGVWFFDSGSKLSDDELIQLLHRAAGSHANSYSLRVNQGWVGATVLTSTPHSQRTLKGEPKSVTHVEALYRRLWQLLPAEKLKTSDPWQTEFLGWRSVKGARFLLMEICGLVYLAALLGALAGGRRMLWFIGGGVVVFCALVALPARTHDVGSLKLVANPPLPPFTPPEIPAVSEFSTPGKAVEAVFDAASRGQKEILRQGMSKALIDVMDKSDEWTAFLNHHKWFRVVATKFNVETDRATVTVKKVGLHGAEPGEYQISVIFEAGLWKVDSLLDWSDTKMVLPATITLPKAAAEKILRAVRERNGGKQRFDAELSRSTRESMTDQERGLLFQDLGDLAMDLGEVENLEFEEKWLDETTAEVLIIKPDDSKRRWTFRMVFEDGTWKLNNHGP